MAESPISIDLRRAAGTSLHTQLCDHWRSRITDGSLRAGQRLPSSRALARALGVSRNTVSNAVYQLVAEGFLDVRQGRRPVVAMRPRVPSGWDRRSTQDAAAASTLSRWAAGLAGDPWPFQDSLHPRAFLPGIADAREFPDDLWARCLRRAGRREWGRSPPQLNRRSLQSALIGHLAEHRGVQAEPRQVKIMPSAQSALGLVARLVLDPGDLAWVEEPGYPGAWSAFRAAGATVVGVPVDAGGLTLPVDSPPPRLVFVTPSHQYPTGGLMPITRREDLLNFSTATGSLIVEDDYDGEFHYDTQPVAALQGLRQNERVFYVGTFSKTTRPDLRVGYVVVPDAVADTFERAQRHTGQFVSAAVQEALADFIREGYFEAHVRRMKRLYRARRDCLVDALSALPALAAGLSPPAGGMQVLVGLPPGLDDTVIAAHAARVGVTLRPLSRHFLGDATASGLFLGFAAWSEREIEAGVAALATCLMPDASRLG